MHAYIILQEQWVDAGEAEFGKQHTRYRFLGASNESFS
jgi:hypothetical protein